MRMLHARLPSILLKKNRNIDYICFCVDIGLHIHKCSLQLLPSNAKRSLNYWQPSNKEKKE